MSFYSAFFFLARAPDSITILSYLIRLLTNVLASLYILLVFRGLRCWTLWYITLCMSFYSVFFFLARVPDPITILSYLITLLTNVLASLYIILVFRGPRCWTLWYTTLCMSFYSVFFFLARVPDPITILSYPIRLLTNVLASLYIILVFRGLRCWTLWYTTLCMSFYSVLFFLARVPDPITILSYLILLGCLLTY